MVKMGKIARFGLFGFIATGIAATFLSQLSDPFVKRLYNEFGIDSAEWVPPALGLMSQWWLPLTAFFGGAICGVGLYLGTRKLGGRSRMDMPSDLPKAERTVLRLRFSGRHEAPIAEFEENIESWFVYWSPEVEMNQPDGTVLFSAPSGWAIFVVFAKDVDYRQTAVTFGTERPRSTQVRQARPRSAVIQLDGPMPACEMEFRTIK